MSVARVFHPVASNTLLAVIIFAKNEATSCRPLEYLLQYSLRNLYLEKIGKDNNDKRRLFQNGTSPGNQSITIFFSSIILAFLDYNVSFESLNIS